MKLLVVLALVVATVNATRLDNLLKPAFSSGRIVNGIEALPGQAPYIVSLQQKSGFHFCAGSMIGPKTVLTAAHCLTSASFNVVAGLHDRTRINSPAQQVRSVDSAQQYRVHKDYKGGVGPNDIGLIYLKEAFVFDNLRDDSLPISSISLPSGKYAQTGDGKLFGWGRDANSQSPEKLHRLDVDVIGYTKCRDALPAGAPVDEDSNICTHAPNKIDGACNGDSGGPLIVERQGERELVGIVSWGYSPCHWSTYPSVYTRVSGFMDWIAENTEELRVLNDF